MRRFIPLLGLALLLSPAKADAQLQLLAGAGVTNPIQDLNRVSDIGWHAMAGFQLGVATLPFRLRGDAGHYEFGKQGDRPKTSVLGGALSLLVPFPGVGLQPYVLGGIGMYRLNLRQEGTDPFSRRGFHGAFGVDIGDLGFGGFAEVRLVQVRVDSGNFRYVVATLGVRI